MADPVRKDEMMDAPHETQTVARFGTPDLNDKGLWMTHRIREKFPHLQDRFILSWLGGATAQNSTYFVHTKNAVAMAERVTESLNAQPSVKVWFVMAKDPKVKEHLDEAADLYNAIAAWAANIGALRLFDLDRFSDVPKPLIQDRLGSRLLVEQALFARIAK